MKAVWKFPLVQYERVQLITMPVGAEILTVQMQYRTPTIWALCDIHEKSRCDRAIHMCATGDTVPHDGKYLGTVQELERFVWHYFEVTNEQDA